LITAPLSWARWGVVKEVLIQENNNGNGKIVKPAEVELARKIGGILKMARAI